MPVIGNQVPSPQPPAINPTTSSGNPVVGSPVPINPQPGRRPTNVYSPLTSKIFDVPVPERTKSVRVQTGMQPTIRWTMAEPDGKAIDLTPYVTVPLTLSSAAEESDAPGA